MERLYFAFGCFPDLCPVLLDVCWAELVMLLGNLRDRSANEADPIFLHVFLGIDRALVREREVAITVMSGIVG